MQVFDNYFKEIEYLKTEYRKISTFLFSEMGEDKILTPKKIYSVINKIFYSDLTKSFDKKESEEIVQKVASFLFCENLFYSRKTPLRKNGDPQLSHLISVLKTFMRYYSDYGKNLIMVVLSHDFGEDHGELHYQEYKKNLAKSREIVLFDNSELNEILNWQRVTNRVTLNTDLRQRLSYLGFGKNNVSEIIENVKYLTRYPGDHYLDYIMKLIFFDTNEDIGDEFFKKIYRISTENNLHMLSEDKLALSYIKISDKIHNTLTLRTCDGKLFNLSHAIRDLVKNLYLFHVYKLFIQQFSLKFFASIPKEKRKEITGTDEVINSVEDLDHMYRLDLFFYNNYKYMTENYYDNPDKHKRIKMAERLFTLSKLIMLLGTLSNNEIKTILSDFKNNMTRDELSKIKSLENDFDDYVETSKYQKITSEKKGNPFDGTINSILSLTQERRLRNSKYAFDKESKTKVYKTFMVLSKLFEDYMSKNAFFVKGFENIDGRITLSERKLIEFAKKVSAYEKSLYDKYHQFL